MTGPHQRAAPPASGRRRSLAGVRWPTALCLLWAAFSASPTLAQSLNLHARLIDDAGRPVDALIEGETAFLQIFVTGDLQAGRTLRLRIDGQQAGDPLHDLRFNGVPIGQLGELALTSTRRTETVSVTARRDGLPEPWEEAALRVRATLEGGALGESLQLEERRVSFRIPYNDYAVRALTAEATAGRDSLRAGSGMRVSAELNAPAPAPVRMILELLESAQPSAENPSPRPRLFREYELRVPTGESSAAFTVTAPRRGESYEFQFIISKARFDAPDDALAGAQVELHPGEPSGIEVYEELKFRSLRLVDADASILQLSEGRFLLSETTASLLQLNRSDSAALEAEVNHFLGHDIELAVSLETRGSAGAGAALSAGPGAGLLQSLQTTLTAAVGRIARVAALPDALKPEPAQEFVLSVSGFVPDTGERLATATLRFWIPHHGYVLDGHVHSGGTSHYPRGRGERTPAGTPMGLEIVMNAAAPSDLNVTLEYDCAHDDPEAPGGQRNGLYYETGVISAGLDRVLITRRFPGHASCLFTVDGPGAAPGAAFIDGLGERVSVDTQNHSHRPHLLSLDPGPSGRDQNYQVSLELRGPAGSIPGIAPESGRRTLRLRIEELTSETRTLDLRLGASIPSAVSFASDELECDASGCEWELNASNLPARGVFEATVEVSVTDDDKPQPRREIQLNVDLIEGREFELGGADTPLTVPRNDYAVTELRLRPLAEESAQGSAEESLQGPAEESAQGSAEESAQELAEDLVQGRHAMLGAELNAPAPAGGAIVQAALLMPNGEQSAEYVEIEEGKAYGERRVLLKEAGLYRYVVEEGKAGFLLAGVVEDQSQLLTRAPELEKTVREAVRLTVTLQNDGGQELSDVREGDRARLLVRAENLEADEILPVHFIGRGTDLFLDLEAGEDLLLTREASEAVVEVGVVQDYNPEPRTPVFLAGAGGGLRRGGG